jgi:hypothetical protein
MQLTDRLTQIEQMAAMVIAESAKIRKELQVQTKKKKRNESSEKVAAEIIARRMSKCKTIYK